ETRIFAPSVLAPSKTTIRYPDGAASAAKIAAAKPAAPPPTIARSAVSLCIGRNIREIEPPDKRRNGEVIADKNGRLVPIHPTVVDCQPARSEIHAAGGVQAVCCYWSHGDLN